jgi:hypothetical protein
MQDPHSRDAVLALVKAIADDLHVAIVNYEVFAPSGNDQSLSTILIVEGLYDLLALGDGHEFAERREGGESAPGSSGVRSSDDARGAFSRRSSDRGAVTNRPGGAGPLRVTAPARATAGKRASGKFVRHRCGGERPLVEADDQLQFMRRTFGGHCARGRDMSSPTPASA